LAALLFAGGKILKAQEDYSALNLLVNLGTISAVNVIYEFNVAKQITVAPVALIDFNGNFWIGVKGSYYFDVLFNLTDPWDTYAGLDLGYRFSKNDNFGIGIFIGGEWHINDTWGLLLEFGGGNLSFGAGVGAAVHF
jgi:hypothetical protein